MSPDQAKVIESERQRSTRSYSTSRSV